MPPSILYELFNSTLLRGTGIATYSKMLCHAASDLGYRVEGLFHTNKKLSRTNEVLTEIQFFDDPQRVPTFMGQLLPRTRSWSMGVPGGFRPVPLPNGNVVIGPDGIGPLLQRLDAAHVAPRFMEDSRLHFNRFGRSVSVKLAAKPDIFHTTQAVPLYVPGAKNVYTIHDLVPLRLPYTTLSDKKFFYSMVRYLGETADRIVTVSETSKQDLIKITGIPAEKIVNTYQAVTFPAAMTAMSAEEAGQLVGRAFDLLPGDYYLFYGAFEPKKNIGRIVDAYVASGTARPLVIAGTLGWQYQADLEKINRLRAGIGGDRIRLLQYLPSYQLVALIRSARALIFPSLYEGFGLPVLESMLLGTPVITSKTSSLGEVAGDAAALVDPMDVSEIMRAIQALDSDEALCAELRAKGFVRAERFSMVAYKERLSRLYEDLLHT